LSRQSIPSGDGYCEVHLTKFALENYVGFGTGNTGTGTGNIQFGFRFQGAVAEVRESNTLRTSTSAVPGDVLRVSVSANVVTYSKNGQVFYTSGLAPSYPLFVDASLLGLGAEVDGAVVFSTNLANAPVGFIGSAGGAAAGGQRPTTQLAASRVTSRPQTAFAAARPAEPKAPQDAVVEWALGLLDSAPDATEVSLFAESVGEGDATSLGIVAADTGKDPSSSRLDWSRYDVALAALEPGTYKVTAYARRSGSDDARAIGTMTIVIR
jgi:hypothetical protein